MTTPTKIQSIILSTFLMTIFAYAQGSSFCISGSADSSLDGNAMSLIAFDGKVGTYLGIDTITDGTFSFNFTIEDESDYKSFALRWENMGGLPVYFYAEPDSRVVINGTGRGSNLATWKIESSDPRQLVRNRLADATKAQLDRINELYIETHNYSNQMRNAPDEETRNALRRSMDSAYNLIDSVQISADSILIGLMRQMTPDSSYLEQLLSMSRNLKNIDTYPYRNEIIEFFDRLPDDLKTTDEGETISLALYPPKVLAPGDTLPTHSLIDLDGNTHQLSEFRGKYILVDFWSVGCYPCVMSFPELSEIAETYRDKVHVVKINVNPDKTWREATTFYGLTGNNFRDSKEMNGLYTNAAQNAVPTYMLINPDGTVHSTWSGYVEGSLKATLLESIPQ